MPDLQFHRTPIPQKLIHSQSPMTPSDIHQWIEALQRSDRSLYNLIAMEAWSMAKTMDDLFPGFWSRFMTNRRVAMQQLKAQRQQQRASAIRVVRREVKRGSD